MSHSIHTPQDKTVWLAWGMIGLGLLLAFGIGNLILPFVFAMTVLVPGLLILAAYHAGGRATAPLAVPGMIVAGTGALLVFQSLTDYWESWIYAWILYGVFIGMGLTMMGRRLEDDSLVRIGRVMTVVSGIAFLGSAFFVIMLTSGALRLLLTIALLSAGGYLLFKNYQNRPRYVMPTEKPKRTTIRVNINDSHQDVHNEVA